MKKNLLDLASFSIKIPADGGDYQFSLQGETVSAPTLKFGVVKLFKDLGIYEMPEILKILKTIAYPESLGRKLLLNILENGSSDLAQLAPEPADSPQRMPEASAIPLEVQEPPPPAVTLNLLAVKPRNHSRDQLILEDPLILAAIKKAQENGKNPRERSYRFIAGELGKQGIKVSHMTISRRMKALPKEIYG